MGFYYFKDSGATIDLDHVIAVTEGTWQVTVHYAGGGSSPMETGDGLILQAALMKWQEAVGRYESGIAKLSLDDTADDAGRAAYMAQVHITGPYPSRADFVRAELEAAV